MYLKGCQHLLPTSPANSKEGCFVHRHLLLSHVSCSVVILGVFLFYYHLAICLQQPRTLGLRWCFSEMPALFCTMCGLSLCTHLRLGSNILQAFCYCPLAQVPGFALHRNPCTNLLHLGD